MRSVVLTEPGVLELNWMWLPTWVGMNSSLKKEIEEHVSKLSEGKVVSDRLLSELSYEVNKVIAKKAAADGVADYLDGLKFVHET